MSPKTARFVFALLISLLPAAQALAQQDKDAQMKTRFEEVARKLAASESTIVEELLAAQGNATDVGGYFRPDAALCEKSMRPSATFNAIIDALN